MVEKLLDKAKDLGMLTKIVIKQGENICRLQNENKQLREENQGLRDEAEYAKLYRESLIRKLTSRINKGNRNKEPFAVILEDVEKMLIKELVDDREIK